MRFFPLFLEKGMSLIDKYTKPSKGGLGGLWNSGTSAVSNFAEDMGGGLGKLGGWVDILMYGGIIIVGGVLLMVAWSFASGTQNFADVARAVR